MSSVAAERASERTGLVDWLRGTRVVFARELGATFDSAIAYVFLIAGLLLVTSLFMNEFFLTGRLDMTPFFDLLPPIFVFLLPAMTMRLWAEEQKTRTFEMLATLPLTPLQTTSGKYFAALVLYGIFLLGTLPIVLMLTILGEPDLGLIFSGYLGALFLGAMFLAFGTFVSALSSDQIVAFVLSTLIAFFFVFIGHEKVVSVLDGLAPALSLGSRAADSIGALPRYEAFVRGLVELSGVVYFVGNVVLFLWLSAYCVQKNRT